ncbi:MAG: RHS repeat-associated core domain-containing protein [Bacteroidota bacterium]
MGCLKLSYRQEGTKEESPNFSWEVYKKGGSGSEKCVEYYRYGFQGEYSEEDSETGWNSFELRMYDSEIGRWMVTDPYGQHWSPYLSMSNDPINQIDPDGGFNDYVQKADGSVVQVGTTGGEYRHQVYNESGELLYQMLSPVTISARQAISVGPTPGWLFTEVDAEFHVDFYGSARFGYVNSADVGPLGFSSNAGAVELLRFGYKYDINDGLSSGNLYSRYIGENGVLRFSAGQRAEFGADLKFGGEYILNLNKGTFNYNKAFVGGGAPFVEAKYVSRHSSVHSIDLGGQEEFSKSYGPFGFTLGFNSTIQFNLTNPKAK